VTCRGSWRASRSAGWPTSGPPSCPLDDWLPGQVARAVRMPAPSSPALRRARPSRTDRGLKGRFGEHLHERSAFPTISNAAFVFASSRSATKVGHRTGTTCSGAWRDWADYVTSAALECGHFLPEEQPKRTAATLRGFPPRLIRTRGGRPHWCRCPTADCPKGWPARRRRCRRRAGTPRPSLPPTAAAPRAVPHSARRTKPQPARLRSGAQGSCPTPANHDGRAGHCGQGQPAGNAERPRGAGVAVIGC